MSNTYKGKRRLNLTSDERKGHLKATNIAGLEEDINIDWKGHYIALKLESFATKPIFFSVNTMFPTIPSKENLESF